MEELVVYPGGLLWWICCITIASTVISLGTLFVTFVSGWFR